MEARNRAFQQLKLVCVNLSAGALKLMGRDGNIKEVSENLKQLQKLLAALATQKDALDSKLAEYVFFPLSSVLKQLEKMPLQARELTFECLLILLQTAWSKQIAPDLGMQLLILFTFVADQQGTKTSEELQAVIFRSMTIVLSSLGSDERGRDALLGARTVPHLGKAVSVVLDATLDGPTEIIQLASLSTLATFCRSVQDRDALAISFLPGIMSCLTKVLTPKAARVSSKVLVDALDVLNYLLPQLFSNVILRELPDAKDDVQETKSFGRPWLTATAPQINMALASIIKLQQHGRQNVRIALANLCSTLLRFCSESLVDSIAMLLEADVTIASQDELVEVELTLLLNTIPALSETLRSSLHYWIISLPRMMESADETKKQRRIHQITLSFRFLKEQGLDMSIINAGLATNLRDSVANAIKNPRDKVPITSVELSTSSFDLLRRNGAQSETFDTIISSNKSQLDTITELGHFVKQLSASNSALETAGNLIGTLTNQTGDMQIASFWLCLNIVKSAVAAEADLDAYVDFGNDELHSKEDVLEQLYDFSVSLLGDTSSASETDWRLKALALEVIAVQACQQKMDFRNELIDALYPILHFMGSAVPALQSHAITSLNIVARQCGYQNPGELIVANVDYLVNAVALRLNTFDISPQAPQVLLMMVKLAGPPLLPYLDDTIDSIFVALESFHGYPKLVDLLFSTLKAIVQEGAKTPQLVITAGEQEGSHKKRSAGHMSVEKLGLVILDLRKRYTDASTEQLSSAEVPTRPWAEEDETEGLTSNEGEKVNGDEMNGRSTNEKEPQPPAARTYSLLLNISKLTQHYLTSSSPELRSSLLDLLSTSFPALAKHENSFLPLINTLWPVLLPRLDDPEPYVVSGSLNIIGVMCQNAGDFMTGRIDDAWPQIGKLYRTRTGRAGNPSTRSQRGTTLTADITSVVPAHRDNASAVAGPHYIDAPSRIIWEALVNMLIDIITHVATSDNIFDDAINILASVITSRAHVREALELRNADAVWLALWRRDSTSSQQGGSSTETVAPKNSPIARSNWQFAPLGGLQPNPNA